MEAWSNAGAASKVANVGLLLDWVSLWLEVSKAKVLDFASRALYGYSVSNFECLKILRHFATLREPRVHVCSVNLDNKIDETLASHVGDWSVLAVLISAVDFCLEHHVVPDWQAECHVRIREAEPKNESVVRDHDLFGQNQTHKSILILLNSLESTSFFRDCKDGACRLCSLS